MTKQIDVNTRVYRTYDHPCVGRNPEPDDREWVLTFRLDNNELLMLCIGEQTHADLHEIWRQELAEQTPVPNQPHELEAQRDEAVRALRQVYSHTPISAAEGDEADSTEPR